MSYRFFVRAVADVNDISVFEIIPNGQGHEYWAPLLCVQKRTVFSVRVPAPLVPFLSSNSVHDQRGYSTARNLLCALSPVASKHKIMPVVYH